jgi:hypothetical protein
LEKEFEAAAEARMAAGLTPKKVHPVIDRSGFAIHNLHDKKSLPIHTRMHFLPATELRFLNVFDLNLLDSIVYEAVGRAFNA